MDAVTIMRQQVKNYIDVADEKVVKMMHAMLEVSADKSWWNTMPDSIKEDLEIALLESENGNVISHTEIQKKYSKWLAK